MSWYHKYIATETEKDLIKLLNLKRITDFWGSTLDKISESDLTTWHPATKNKKFILLKYIEGDKECFSIYDASDIS